MNLNDPFGRLARRDEKEYQALCEVLKRDGVDNTAAVQHVEATVRNRVLMSIGVVLAATLLLAILLPKWKVIVFAISIFVVFWMVKVLVSSKRHLQRYIENELSE